MKNALIITTFNRAAELRQCVDSLRKAKRADVLIVVDDASSNRAAILGPIMELEGEIHVINKQHNKGIKDSLMRGFDLAFNYLNCDLAINLDPDAIVKPDFIQKLTTLYDGKHIVSGFNCNHPKNPILSEHEGYVMRQHANGINMLVDKKQYETILLPALKSPGNWDYAATNKFPFKITLPSLIQHIAPNNSTMGHKGGDVACDFKLLTLPDVTLFAIDSHDPIGITKAADICQRDIDFGAVTIITDDLFTRNGSREARRADYSRFMIKDLVKYVETSHVLTIHADGYVVNPSAWDNEWLNFDYIGASWWHKDGMNVGNGGFSLRSRKLLEMLSKMDIKVFHPEDEIICRRLRPALEKQGIKFAPESVADKFSIEVWGGKTKYIGQFGFHGENIDFSSLPVSQRPYELTKARGKRIYPALEDYKKKAIGRYRR